MIAITTIMLALITPDPHARAHNGTHKLLTHIFATSANQYNQVMEEVEELDGDDSFNDRRFFNFVGASYCAFLSGDDEHFDELNEELQHNFGACLGPIDVRPRH